MKSPLFIRNVLKKHLDAFSLKSLEAEAKQWRVPAHLGLILDGNRRFAKKRHLWNATRKQFGYDHGANKIEEMLQWCDELDIPILSAWVFSSENFQRTPAEIEAIFGSVKRKARDFLSHPLIHSQKVKIRFLGEIQALPSDVQKAIHAVEEATKDYHRRSLNICIGYSGREEILRSLRQHLLAQCAEGKDLATVAHELCVESVTRHLYTSGLPDPDLIIRPGGAIRPGSFLLWQSVVTEYYFCSTYWPEFSKRDFFQSIREYSHRDRTFGK